MLRYFISTIRTVQAIKRQKPEIVAVQNPSIVLTVIAIFLRPVFGYKIVVDAHNSGIFPKEGRSPLLMSAAKWLQRAADLTVVTNRELKTVVESNGGKAFVLPDRLPEVCKSGDYPLDGEVNIVYICTYGADEPYNEVLKAARLVPKNIVIYVTGRPNGKVNQADLPENIRLLGYVPDQEFWALLSSSDFIMDLTLREGCLVCGAYEGVSISKPLILSDTRALRSYFDQGCVYVMADAESIAQGIIYAIKDADRLRSDIHTLKSRLEVSWKNTLKDFNCTLDAMVNP
jgi:glycosyltransferase involved in cell wall biosynthesis